MATKKSTTKKPADDNNATKAVKRPVNDAKDKATIDAIKDTASSLKDAINKKRKPELKLPIRALSNVSYDPKKGYFEIGKDKKVRALTVSTVKTFAQTLKLMALSSDLVKNNDHATKRDAYYQSKNWGDARFDEQTESDTIMDDIEALFSTSGVSREQLRFTPDQHGGSVAGELVIIDRNPDGSEVQIDCTKQGSGAWTVPSSVEPLKLRSKAKFVLAIETTGMFSRLNEHQYWATGNCILV